MHGLSPILFRNARAGADTLSQGRVQPGGPERYAPPIRKMPKADANTE
jgi:hypothetical protein